MGVKKQSFSMCVKNKMLSFALVLTLNKTCLTKISKPGTELFLLTWDLSQSRDKSTKIPFKRCKFNSIQFKHALFHQFLS